MVERRQGSKERSGKASADSRAGGDLERSECSLSRFSALQLAAPLRNQKQ
jgi:hypothetical protein